MITKYTLKNSNGATLKYAFNDRFVFNGENENARKDVTLTVAKRATVEKLLERATTFGLTGIEIIEIECEKKIKEKKEIINENNVENEEELQEINDGKNTPDIDPEYLFSKLNEKCMNCKKECKQSAKAQVLKCKDFEKI